MESNYLFQGADELDLDMDCWVSGSGNMILTHNYDSASRGPASKFSPTSECFDTFEALDTSDTSDTLDILGFLR